MIILDWLKRVFNRNDIYSNLPDCAKVDKETGIIIVEHRSIKGYFTRGLVEQFKKSNVDFIEYFKDSVDEFLEDMEEKDYES